VHAADEAVEHTLLSAVDAISKAGLIVDGRPDAVSMLTLSAANSQQQQQQQQELQ
jgi:hypothetical protein